MTSKFPLFEDDEHAFYESFRKDINSSIKLPPTVNPKTDISSLKTLRYPQELKQPTGAESKKKAHIQSNYCDSVNRDFLKMDNVTILQNYSCKSVEFG